MNYLLGTDPPDVHPHRIVVGIDGSPESLAALNWAVREAECTQGVVDAVLAYDSHLAWIDVGSDYQRAILEGSAAHASAELHEALSKVEVDPQGPVLVHPIVVAGSPAEVLVEVAQSADLLVLGTRGRGAFAGLLLGSTSQRCAERSSCPVVIVPRGLQTNEDES